MGYWSANKSGHQTYKEWAKKKYTHEDDNIRHTVLDAALVNFNELYVACERLSKKDGVKYVYCMVAILRRDKDNDLMVKEMDETMNPYYYNCPERIFKLLSPVRKLRVLGDSFKYCREWRETVSSRYTKKSNLKSLTYGMIIKVNHMLNFRQAGKDIGFNKFKVVDEKKLIFAPVGGSFLVKLSRRSLNETAWSIVS